MVPTIRRQFAFLLLVLSLSSGALDQRLDAQVAAEQTTRAETDSESGTADEAHSEGWMPTVAKVFNFVLLIGALTYFLKSPVSAHLAARHASIRRALVEAQSLRDTADGQLSSIRARLSELPGELRALEARGREELSRERERMRTATAAERDKLVLRTRKEIDLQFRVARRELIEHAADLAMALARTRIEQQITPADHARLIDRYANEVRS